LRVAQVLDPRNVFAWSQLMKFHDSPFEATYPQFLIRNEECSSYRPLLCDAGIKWFEVNQLVSQSEKKFQVGYKVIR
jgi:hypothetical protein